MANIYNIQQDLYAIITFIEENEGIVDEETLQALNITETEFKSKVEAYTNVIKSLESDLNAIKEEKARLDSLKKSKERTIERLSNILKEAILAFGDTTKSGSKFIDYGIGKVSLRRSEVVELDDESLNCFAKTFTEYCNWVHYRNTFDQGEGTIEDLISYCQDNKDVWFTEDDLNNISGDLSIRVNFKDLLSNEEGRRFIQSLLNYNVNFNAKPAIDKKAIKEMIKSDGICPSYANLVTKQNVTIK